MRRTLSVVVIGLVFWGVSEGSSRKNIIKTNAISDAKGSSKVIPLQLNYQGWVGSYTDTTGLNGRFNMAFGIYSSSAGGAPLWEEIQDSVPVSKGIFNVLLGSVTPLPSGIFTGAFLYLETQVDGEVLSPRKELVSVAYAIKSNISDTAGYAYSSGSIADTMGMFFRRDKSDSAENGWWKFIADKDSVPISTAAGVMVTHKGFIDQTSKMNTSLYVEGKFNNFIEFNGSPVQESQTFAAWTHIYGHDGSSHVLYKGVEGYVYAGQYEPINNCTGGPAVEGTAELLANAVGDNVAGIGIRGKVWSNSLRGSQTGGYFSVGAFGNGEGPKTGIYSEVLGSSLYDVHGFKAVVKNDILAGNQTAYGGEIDIKTDGVEITSTTKGLNVVAQDTGNGVTYGIYTEAGGSSTASKFGIYAKSPEQDNSYAGYFDGNVHIAGKLTGDDTLAHIVSFSEFSAGSGAKYSLSDGCVHLSSPSSNVSMFAPIHLPQGAVIKRITSYWDDNDSNYDITIKVRKSYYIGGAPISTTICEISTGGSAGAGATSWNDSHIIDYRDKGSVAGNHYEAYLYFPAGINTTSGVRTIKIDYAL